MREVLRVRTPIAAAWGFHTDSTKAFLLNMTETFQMNLKKTMIALSLAALATGSALADEGRQIPHLDHAWVIVMENHPSSQILGNTAAPFLNSYAQAANLAANYYGVGHPSLTNYLEIVGASNFGVVNDNSPDWHNATCTPALTAGPSLEGSPNICPIAGAGTDAATPAKDTTNEGTAAVPIYNDYVAPAATVGKTIADQLVEAGLSWKSYQENLPSYGANLVNWSDGLVSDSTVDSTAPIAGIPHLYAVNYYKLKVNLPECLIRILFN